MMRSHPRLLVALALLAAAGAGAGACGSVVGAPGAASASTGAEMSTGSSGAGGAMASASSASSSSSSSATGGVGGAAQECAGVVPVPASDGSDSGFARCPDDTIHRTTPAACDPSVGVVACTGLELIKTCATDAECAAHPHGRCARNYRLALNGAGNYCDCVYPCANDAECDAGQVCVCAGVVSTVNPWAICAPATCVSGQDCPSGECGISSLRLSAFQCFADVELACRAPSDACRSDADCADPAYPLEPRACALPYMPAWQCVGQLCSKVPPPTP
jgi:hypothetical protein